MPLLYRPKRIEAGSQRDICTPMFTGHLFTITKTWKKPNCPSIHGAKHDIYIVINKKEMATHSSVLAWRIPGTAEPGGLLSLGSHRVGHD